MRKLRALRTLSIAERCLAVALVCTAGGFVGRCEAQTVPAAPPSSAQDARPSVIWRVDAGVERRLERLRAGSGAPAEAIARAGNWWGGPGVIVFAAILWLGARVIGKAGTARVGLRGAEGLAVASAISGIVKGIAGRARPAITPGEPWHWHFNRGWTNADYFSMPSGHTTATVAFAVATIIAAWRFGRGRGVALGAALTLSAIWVGFSRMYTNQHWLSDVVAGATLGATTSLVLARTFARHPAVAYHRAMLGRGSEAR